MARKKAKPAARRKTGRKRIGAVGSLMDGVIAPIVGAVGAQLVTNSFLKNASPLVKAAVPAGIGFFLVKFTSKPLTKGIGAGMLAVGGAALVNSFSGRIAQTVSGILPAMDAVSGPGMLQSSSALAGGSMSKYAIMEAATV
jgi:hypothetical protein